MDRLSIRLAVLLALMLLASLAFTPAAYANENEYEDAVQNAIEWLLEQQADDGGFPGFDGASDPGATADAAVALAAASIASGDEFEEVGPALEYLESVAEGYSASQGGAAKLVLAYAAAGHDASDVAGLDLVALLDERAENGAYDEQVFIHATAVLAIIAAGADLIDGAIDFLVERQIEDGSWAFTGEPEPGMGDTNTTSVVIQALVAAGEEEHEAINAGIAYLEGAQLDDGPIVYAIGAEDPAIGDSNSTALVIQAMLAAGIDTNDERNSAAMEALISFQNESGALGYREDMPDDNALSTAQGLPALLGMPLPISGDSTEDAEAEGTGEEQAVEPGDPDRCDYFERTGHNLCHGFREFWWDNGGLPIFGYPLSEEFDDQNADGSEVVVQYFERARLEYSMDAPEGERINLVALGPQTIDTLEQTEILDLEGPCELFDDAEYSVCGPFIDYWNDFGSDAIFGLPITDAYGADGMMVQVFEYARFEHHPDVWPERQDVLLGRIGAEVLAKAEDSQ